MLSKNGGSSSAVERQIVDLLVEGSIPFFHPTTSLGGSALSSKDRASDFESAGCRFESYRAQQSRAASSAGRAADS